MYSRAITSVVIFILAIFLIALPCSLAVFAVGGEAGPGEGIDNVAPRMVNELSQTGDSDNDGKIDYIDVFFSENLSSSPDESDFIVNGYVVSSVGRISAEAFHLVLAESGAFDSGARPSVSIGSAAVDEASNAATLHAMTPRDGALPVLVGASPSQGGTLNTLAGSFTLRFSEDLLNSSVTADTITVEGAGNSVLSFSESAGAVTVRQTSGSFDPNTTVTVTVRGAIGELQDTAGNPLNSSGTVFGTNVGDDVEYVFVTSAGSQDDDDEGEETSQTPAMSNGEVAIVTPNTAGSVFGGSNYMITWAAMGSINNIVLYYSTDGGETFRLIASGEKNDGAYGWIVPNAETSNAIVKIIGRNVLGETLSTDESDQAFSIMLNVTMPEDTSESFETSVLMTAVDGREVELNEWSKFRGETLPGVYIVKPDGTRSVFPDELTYFSWYDSFDDVVVVKDNQLNKLELGSRITIKPGSYLVKIQSVPDVYEITDGPVLHHIPDEATAAARYGDDWATWVRDIPVVFFSDYTIGRPI